jgi:hypothetical protein
MLLEPVISTIALLVMQIFNTKHGLTQKMKVINQMVLMPNHLEPLKQIMIVPNQGILQV